MPAHSTVSQGWLGAWHTQAPTLRHLPAPQTLGPYPLLRTLPSSCPCPAPTDGPTTMRSSPQALTDQQVCCLMRHHPFLVVRPQLAELVNDALQQPWRCGAHCQHSQHHTTREVSAKEAPVARQLTQDDCQHTEDTCGRTRTRARPGRQADRCCFQLPCSCCCKTRGPLHVNALKAAVVAWSCVTAQHLAAATEHTCGWDQRCACPKGAHDECRLWLTFVVSSFWTHTPLIPTTGVLTALC